GLVAPHHRPGTGSPDRTPADGEPVARSRLFHPRRADGLPRHARWLAPPAHGSPDPGRRPELVVPRRGAEPGHVERSARVGPGRPAQPRAARRTAGLLPRRAPAAPGGAGGPVPPGRTGHRMKASSRAGADTPARIRSLG